MQQAGSWLLRPLRSLGAVYRQGCEYANHVSALMRNFVFDPVKATRSDVERVVAWINGQPYKSSIKVDLRLTVRKIVQYAKSCNCCKKTPLPLFFRSVSNIFAVLI